ELQNTARKRVESGCWEADFVIISTSMKKGRLLIFTGVGLVVIAAAVFFGKDLIKPERAALQVSSTPEAEVFLNGESQGKTPFYSTELKAGTYVIKLQPVDGSQGAVVWEQEIDLPANIMTSINRQLKTDSQVASGRILSLEKTGDKKFSSIRVIADPEDATVFLNGESKGFSPYQEDLPEDKYQLKVDSSGYSEQSFEIKTVVGYRLNVMIKLAKEEMEGVVEGDEVTEDEIDEEVEEEVDEDEETKTDEADSELERPYVEINETPTGWLRVRSEPSTSGEEVAKVEPDETYPFLDEENGWYEIEYEDGESGWISGVYAELFE
ncbi:PEGA domain-containing protein, partial [Patescibacteria group bacterium]|nr:PEGA domain-containing protein [Patescibacteria group bacterium]